MAPRNGAISAETFIHLIAGGTAGTAGAIVTCPLEVVKTRLQSSNSGFTSDKVIQKQKPASKSPEGPGASSRAYSSRLVVPEVARVGSVNGVGTVPLAQQLHTEACSSREQKRRALLYRGCATKVAVPTPQQNTMGVWQCLRFIVTNEGVRGLFKGLGPNLVGVAPSRAIYFWAYHTTKASVNASLPQIRDSPFVHCVSAGSAGLCSSTATNPIWLIKTRLQLDRASGEKTLTVSRCIKKIYQERGIPGFWRGVTASYWGISETIIHFVLYERLKKEIAAYLEHPNPREKSTLDFFSYMLCGACSKSCATIVAYPHEVARTRLREEGSKYHSFWQTIMTVAREEGRRGLYRGLATQLIRQIPNTAIMMSVYELTVYLLQKYVTEGRLGPTPVSKASPTASTTPTSSACSSTNDTTLNLRQKTT